MTQWRETYELMQPSLRPFGAELAVVASLSYDDKIGLPPEAAAFRTTLHEACMDNKTLTIELNGLKYTGMSVGMIKRERLGE